MPRQQLRGLLFAICALAALAAAPRETQAQGAWTQVGVLTCRLNPSIGFIIVGHQSMECRFQPAGPIRHKPTRERSTRSVLTLA